MLKKARIGIYLEDEEMARQIKIAAAKRGTSVSAYCGDAIEERLVKDGERNAASAEAEALRGRGSALTAKMDRLSRKIGPIGIPAAELVREGRRR